jgi:hypothetical protein
MAKEPDEKFNPKETQERFDTALKRMLSTPHKPHKPLRKKKKAATKKSLKRPQKSVG